MSTHRGGGGTRVAPLDNPPQKMYKNILTCKRLPSLCEELLPQKAPMLCVTFSPEKAPILGVKSFTKKGPHV